MAYNNDQIFPGSVQKGQALCTTAKTVFTDGTNLVELKRGDGSSLAGPNGGLIRALKAAPQANVTATNLLIYSSLDGGVTFRLVPRLSATMAAQNVTATAGVTATDLGPTESVPYRLAPGEKLYAAIGVSLASGIVFEAEADIF